MNNAAAAEQSSTSPGPAFAGLTIPPIDRRPRKLLIGGQWVDALSGKTFPSINPSTGEVIAQVAQAGAEDVDRAVAAARQAFEDGPWRAMRPVQRQALLWSLADAVAEHFVELRTLEAVDMGLPIGRDPGAKAAENVAVLRYFAGLAATNGGHTLRTPSGQTSSRTP